MSDTGAESAPHSDVYELDAVSFKFARAGTPCFPARIEKRSGFM